MPTKTALTPRERRFIAEYVIDLNGTQAAIRAGYSKLSARQMASELLARPLVLQAVQTLKATQLAKADLTADRVLEELRRVAFSNIRRFFTDDDAMLPISALTEQDAAAISGFEIVKKNLDPGDGHSDVVHKFKLWDKNHALEILAKHHQLLIERVEVSGDEALIAVLKSAHAIPASPVEPPKAAK